MSLFIYKGDGWIAETDNGDVVLYDINAPDAEELRSQIGSKVWLGDTHGTLTDVRYVRGYFGRYSAPGYTDCTSWEYDTNKRRLTKTLRDLYGPQD